MKNVVAVLSAIFLCVACTSSPVLPTISDAEFESRVQHNMVGCHAGISAGSADVRYSDGKVSVLRPSDNSALNAVIVDAVTRAGLHPDGTKAVRGDLTVTVTYAPKRLTKC